MFTGILLRVTNVRLVKVDGIFETADSHSDPKLVTQVGDQAGSLWGQKRCGQERGEPMLSP